MEFKLNKIDTSIRLRINESTKEGKVHGSNRDFKVDKDKNNDGSKQKFNLEMYKKKNKEKILVNAAKQEDTGNSLTNCDIITDDDSKGKHIDVRK